ncbi:MAG: UDP-N-acetylmuramate dehydrogenase [bacterium]
MLGKFCSNMNIRSIKDYDFGSLHGYKTKGIVAYYAETSSRIDLVELLKKIKQNEIKIIACGEGSNTLIRDRFDGLFIKWTEEKITLLNNKEMDDQNLKNDEVLLKVSSSVKKSDLTEYCINNSLSGLEFWAGIPGLVGGGTAMNAGAYCSQAQDCVHEIELASPDGIKILPANNLAWGYRKVNLPPYSVLLSTTFLLKRSDKDKVKKQSEEYIMDREKKHPLEYPSCGSVFKNPVNSEPGKGAWFFINEAGLSDFSIGGARVSKKHTNFIINSGGATSRDVIALISKIKETVYNKFKVRLEEEIKII